MLKIAIAGAAGRMGRTLITAVNEASQTNPEIRLSAAIARSGSTMVGVDAGEMAGIGKIGIPVVASLDDADFDLLIDFTLIEPTLVNLEYCRKHNKNCLLYTSPSPRDKRQSRMPSSA